LNADSPCIGTGRDSDDRGAYPFATSIIGDVSAPIVFALFPNYPNPFNAQTSISYTLPYASRVTLDIYDILGRKVQRLYDGNQAAGTHSLIWDAQAMASGMYFYKLTAGEYEKSSKMMLVK
jgi:hypothetical protein